MFVGVFLCGIISKITRMKKKTSPMSLWVLSQHCPFPEPASEMGKQWSWRLPIHILLPGELVLVLSSPRPQWGPEPTGAPAAPAVPGAIVPAGEMQIATIETGVPCPNDGGKGPSFSCNPEVFVAVGCVAQQLFVSFVDGPWCVES